MQNDLTIPFSALFLSGVLLALPVHAETTADALSRIEAETLVLKAQERQLAVKTKILQLQTDINARQTSIEQSTRPGAPGDPTVQSIEGIGEAVFATLMFENGSSIDVRTGDILPNGMRVLSIKTNEVTVSTDKRRSVRLLPGNAAVIAAASGAVQTTVSLPALPPPGSIMAPPGNMSPVPRLPVKAPGK